MNWGEINHIQQRITQLWQQEEIFWNHILELNGYSGGTKIPDSFMLPPYKGEKEIEFPESKIPQVNG